MTRAPTRSRARPITATLAGMAMAMAMVAQAPAAWSQGGVTALTGGAFGYWADDISLFGGAQPDTGPTPTVTLASDASNSPQTAAADCGFAGYGPATLFTSDDLSVTTAGSLGAGGSVTTDSSITNINKATDSTCMVDTNKDGTPDTAVTSRTGSEIITADNLAGTATADESGTNGSTTVTNGYVEIHSNAANNCPSATSPCGGHTHPLDDPTTPDRNETNGPVDIPTTPPPNYKVEGHVHLDDTTIDNYVIVFNEQVTNPDGSITVNPAHVFYAATLDEEGNIVPDPPYGQGGSVLHGDLYLGQVVAGVTAETAASRAVADFDGDGDSDISVFRPANGGWYVRDQFTTYHGREGDMPVPADYDGDGDTDVAVFRPANGGWYIQGQQTTYFGRNGDIPVPGDYNGDSVVDLAVFRPSNGGWYIQGEATVFHGVNGDVPVPGDYDADGTTEIAVFRPDNGGWYVRGQSAVFHGVNGDVPVPGDYDADGTTDIAVFRPANGGWYVRGQTPVYFGRSGDIPLPLPAAIHQSM